jgi:hypothetical protein
MGHSKAKFPVIFHSVRAYGKYKIRLHSLDVGDRERIGVSRVLCGPVNMGNS